MVKHLAVALLSSLLVSACTNPSQTPDNASADMADSTNRPFNTPDWAKTATLYELNVRQYTPEGTLNAAKPHLERLADMGVDVVWIMPIYPISKVKRKGTMGSYYASSTFTDVNPEFGTLEDFRGFVDEVHRLGMHVILDWTANHTGWDHPWITEQPEYYTKREGTDTIRHAFNPGDAGGGDTDWYDIAQLDHSNPALDSAMIEDMKFWLRDYDVDGFRCDVAGFVPLTFWFKVRPALESVKPVFMLAEWGDEPRHFEAAFDINYGWDFHKLLNALAEGKEDAESVWRHQAKDTSEYPDYAYHLNFTSNHDENSWNGTEYERMGDFADAMFVIAATFEGAPLVYSGQEEPLRKRLEFFEKDDIGFKDFAKEPFFRRLLSLKHRSPALGNGIAGARATRVDLLEADDKILAYTRQKGKDGIVVVVNLSKDGKPVSLASGYAEGDYYDVMSGAKQTLNQGTKLRLPGAGYRVFSTLQPNDASAENR